MVWYLSVIMILVSNFFAWQMLFPNPDLPHLVSKVKVTIVNDKIFPTFICNSLKFLFGTSNFFDDKLTLCLLFLAWSKGELAFFLCLYEAFLSFITALTLSKPPTSSQMLSQVAELIALVTQRSGGE